MKVFEMFLVFRYVSTQLPNLARFNSVLSVKMRPLLIDGNFIYLSRSRFVLSQPISRFIWYNKPLSQKISMKWLTLSYSRFVQ